MKADLCFPFLTVCFFFICELLTLLCRFRNPMTSDPSRKRKIPEDSGERPDPPKKSKTDDTDLFKGIVMPVLVAFAWSKGLKCRKSPRAALVADLVAHGVTRADIEVEFFARCAPPFHR